MAPGAPGWTAAAAFIAAEFARRYGAGIAVAPVTLAVLLRGDGHLLGAAGLRFATEGFFSERYLDAPAAAILSRASGGAVRAEEVIEVVSLACTSPLATLPLIEAIIDEGRSRGMAWGLFTATSRLARLLARTGTPLLRLAPAPADRVENPAAWGSYYATDPWVCALPDTGQSLTVVNAAAALRAARPVPTNPRTSLCA